MDGRVVLAVVLVVLSALYVDGASKVAGWDSVVEVRDINAWKKLLRTTGNVLLFAAQNGDSAPNVRDVLGPAAVDTQVHVWITRSRRGEEGRRGG